MQTHDYGESESEIRGGESLREHAQTLLEFDVIRERVADRVTYFPARQLALSLQPSYDEYEVALLQQETAEGRAVLDEAGEVDMFCPDDIEESVVRASIGGILTGMELLSVAQTLDVQARARSGVLAVRQHAPMLADIAESIPNLSELTRQIRARIGERGEVRDDATHTLRALRSQIRQAYRRVTDSLNSLIQSSQSDNILQDNVISVRNDRLVVQVKAEMRSRIPGIVHDASNTGATLFIEPFSTVDIGNTWRELALAEEREIRKVLRDLSTLAGELARDIRRGSELTTHLDLIMARARYSYAIRGVRPLSPADATQEIAMPNETVEGDIPASDNMTVRLVNARHPMLGRDAVPVNMSVGPSWSVLVVTGPNTGGKTVALKTLGLLALMRQSGMMLPCEPSTRLPLFDAVYADIGDQQSIERAVSTFSSHVRAIIGVLEHATPRSLALLDELGASTDPEEGSALAKAVVRRLVELGAPTVATTHHRSLAGIADEDERVGNASVELHPVTLRPTYKLTMGLPGRSYAMEIASRLGLDPGVVAAAQGYLDPRHREMEGLLAAMQQERHVAREKLDEAEAQRAEAARLAAELERRIEELEAAQAAVVEQARAELLEEAKRVRAKLRQAESAADWQAFRGAPPPPRVLEQAADDVTEAQRTLRAKSFGRDGAPSRRKARLRVGESVEIGSLGFTGVVLTEADGSDRVEVQVGSARLKLESSRLRRAGEAPASPEGRTSVSLAQPPDRPRVGEEIDLRGERAHEALEKLDQQLDAALAQGLSNVRIVHGKGTGALRRAVWRHLASSASVSSYALAPRERGGDGATEVVLT